MPLDIFLKPMSHYIYMHLDIYRRSRHRGPSSRALKGTTMDTEDTQNNDENRGDSIRPFGYWLRTLDALITTEFDKALQGDEAPPSFLVACCSLLRAWRYLHG